MNEVKDNEYTLDRQYNTEKYIVGETKKQREGKGKKEKKGQKKGKKRQREEQTRKEKIKKWRGEEGTVCADSELY